MIDKDPIKQFIDNDYEGGQVMRKTIIGDGMVAVEFVQPLIDETGELRNEITRLESRIEDLGYSLDYASSLLKPLQGKDFKGKSNVKAAYMRIESTLADDAAEQGGGA